MSIRQVLMNSPDERLNELVGLWLGNELFKLIGSSNPRTQRLEELYALQESPLVKSYAAVKAVETAALFAKARALFELEDEEDKVATLEPLISWPPEDAPRERFLGWEQLKRMWAAWRRR